MVWGAEGEGVVLGPRQEPGGVLGQSVAIILQTKVLV